MDSDYYKTPSRESSAELKVSGSRFLAQVFIAENEEHALSQILTVRKAMYDATHHCTAYRVGAEDPIERFNDDGEPSGTAGPPILRRIESSGLTNILVVVTRYYGGTKLGTGGLIRAYGESAQLAIEESGVRRYPIEKLFQIRFEYDDTSAAMHLVSKFEGRITSTEYGQDTMLVVAFRNSFVPQLAEAFRDGSAGRVAATRLEPDPGTSAV